MVAVKGAEAERMLATPDPQLLALLVFGPDAGLVAERGAAFIRARIGDPPDPFGLVRLEGDEIAADPERLLEEAHTVSLFGGSRVLRIRLGARAIHGIMERLLAGPRPEAGILIEAGDLKRSHALRALFEKARNAAVLACYPDHAADLSRLIDAELGTAGLSITADARAALIELLGADRLGSRQELQKLALYAQDTGRIDYEAVEAIVADASAAAVDKVVEAAFGGDPARLDGALNAAFASGVSPQAVLAMALRQAFSLAVLKAAGSQGDRGGWNLPPQRRLAQEEALRRWSPAALDAAVQRLGEATLASRRHSDLARVIVGRTLLALAATGRPAR